MKIKLLLILVVFSCVSAFAQSAEQLNFFAGTWKREGRESYEQWEKSGDSFRGKSYKVNDGKEILSETLEIKSIDGKIYYLATTLNQNKGATIKFVLTNSKDNEFVFENPEHDFPKKIVYKKVSETEMAVQVLGDGGKGFSFKMAKVQATQRNTETTMPKWLTDHFEFLTSGTGRWIADNSKFKSEREPFDEYGIEWTWGLGKKTLKGRLFALRDKKELGTFWDYRIYWHPQQRKVIAQQFNGGGIFGEGEMKLTESDGKAVIELEQTFFGPDGTSWKQLHKNIDGKDDFQGESFNFINGKWNADRVYIWKRSS